MRVQRMLLGVPVVALVLLMAGCTDPPTTPAPTVSAVAPSSGPEAGGTTVTITGTDLTGATVVKFGSSDATTVTVVSATEISAVTPPGTGTVPVTVTTPGGTSAAAPGAEFSYDAPPPPDPTGLTPGDCIDTSSPDMRYIGPITAAWNFQFFMSTDGTCTGPGGNTTVVYVDPDGDDPAAAAVVECQVRNAAWTNVAQAADVVQVAPGIPTPGTYFCTDSQELFYPPTVTVLAPSAGPEEGGTEVVISGQHLTGATAVSFGSTPATTFTEDSDTQITATAPAGTGAVDVTVTTPYGTNPPHAWTKFHYGSTPSDPTGLTPGECHDLGNVDFQYDGPIDSSPNGKAFSGSGDGSCSLVDAPFSGVFGVTLVWVDPLGEDPEGAASLACQGWNPTWDQAGDWSVHNGGPASPGTYMCTQSAVLLPPAVLSLTPATGPEAGGTEVLISGMNLSGATSVMFGSVPATITSNTQTKITAVAPPGTGEVDVTVTSPLGTTAAGPASAYTYQP